MLNVPDAVKALYKLDRVRKNFRAHFPNGERADITNSDVVQESLHFTESLCSRDVFRFGLAEASVIEFETVGVGNIYGAVMECGIEIDVSSLTAAQISAIQAGTWDGALVLLADSDRGYPYFRVPLGVFRVDSCPRNHRAMAHRKVTAYSYSYGGGLTQLVSPYTAWRMANTYTIYNVKSYGSLKRYVDANVGWYRPELLASEYTRAAAYTSTSTSSPVFTRTEAVTGGTLEIKLTPTAAQPQSAQNYDGLMAVDVVDFDNSAAFTWIAGRAEALGVEISEGMTDFLRRWLCLCVANSSGWVDPNPHMPFTESIPAVCVSASDLLSCYVPTGATVKITYTPTGGSAQAETATFSFTDSFPVQLYTLAPVAGDGPCDLPISFAATGQTFSQYGTKYYTYADALDVSAVALGYIELTGRSYKDDRAGGLKEATLSPSAPIAVSPSDYPQGEMWWDEYDVSPIGTVTVVYKNGSDGEVTRDLEIGPGRSVYDMSDNAALRVLSSATISQVQAMLGGDFYTNAQAAGFTPIELTMRGWPWMEAGDALAVEAEDGTIVNTYALRIELDGIQDLTARINAQGGEIIGEV